MKNLINFIVGLWKREPDLATFLRQKSQELKDLESDVVAIIVAARGGPVDLIHIYDVLPTARKLFAERMDFVNAFSHFLKG